MNSLSLTNTRNGTFNNLYMVLPTLGATSIFDIFAQKSDVSSITGLPPETLNTLQKIADAIHDDPEFFNYVNTQLNLKRNIADSYDKYYIDNLINLYYTKLQIDSILNSKLDSSLINNYYTTTQTTTLLNNYYNKSYIDNNINAINSNINLKVDITTLLNYYTSTTINSILTNFSYADMKCRFR